MNPIVASGSVDPDLAQAALDAVRLWRYKPATLNGQPVEILTEISMSFRLVD
jgi:outer membrane biosynthesis protein TonB